MAEPPGAQQFFRRRSREDFRERNINWLLTMALTSTLFTGLSGLDVNQTKLNVVGNNIANANTVAFKASRALFKPQFYVTDNAGGPSTADFGGENPSQRGLGATIAAVQKDFSAGAIDPTGKPTDFAIDGDGFFIVQGKEQRYTRDGSFILNERNQLVSTNGDFVQGFGVDAQGNVIAGTLQNIQIPLGSLTRATATENASLQGNLNANGSIASGSSILASNVALTDATNPLAPVVPAGTTLLTSLRDVANPAGPALFTNGDTLTLAGKRGGRNIQPPLSFAIDATTTVDQLNAFMNQGMQIDTTDTTAGITPGAKLDATGAPANSAFLAIIGNVGSENALSLNGGGFSSSNSAMNLTFADTPQSSPTGESVHTSFVAYDSLGTPLTIDMTAVLVNKSNTGTTWKFTATSPDDTDAAAFDPLTLSTGARIGTGTMSFDSDGKLVSTNNATVQLTRAATGAASPLNIALDFAGMTALTSAQSQMLMNRQDGTAMGTLTSFSVGPNGIITGAFDNGLTANLGQVAVATFDNPEGLIDNGSNLFTTGANSGQPKISGPLQLTAGQIRAGALEASNVDLSTEFVNLIVASTGFSAASRVITTSDQLITELLNTSR
jgi:flagellar hook protein FlgE